MSVPETDTFKDLTVLLPVINETYSLSETVETIMRESGSHVRELLIVVADGVTTKESMATIATIVERYPDLAVVHHQKLKYLGGAMQEAFDLARGSHLVLMSSDLETDPILVPQFVAIGQQKPNGIVTVTRWKAGGGFEAYNPVKYVANALFQRIISVLYGTPLSDLTYAYRLMPTKLVQAIKWEELRHPFLLETVIKPLRLGVEVTEIPGRWRARTEGESQNTFMRNFEYFRIAWRVRFASRQSLLR